MTTTRPTPTQAQASRLLRGAALIVALWTAAAACGGQAGAPYSDRDALRVYVDQAPGVPLVLPTTLPAPYVFLGPGFEQSKDDRVFV